MRTFRCFLTSTAFRPVSFSRLYFVWLADSLEARTRRIFRRPELPSPVSTASLIPLGFAVMEVTPNSFHKVVKILGQILCWDAAYAYLDKGFDLTDTSVDKVLDGIIHVSHLYL